MPKSGRVRSVPMAPDVGRVLAQLGQREHFASDDDLVFAGEAGGYLDGSALRRRYDGALSRPACARPAFMICATRSGTRMIARADIRRVQEWMGHSDVQTSPRRLDRHAAAVDSSRGLQSGRWRSARERGAGLPTRGRSCRAVSCTSGSSTAPAPPARRGRGTRLRSPTGSPPQRSPSPTEGPLFDRRHVAQISSGLDTWRCPRGARRGNRGRGVAGSAFQDAVSVRTSTSGIGVP